MSKKNHRINPHEIKKSSIFQKSAVRAIFWGSKIDPEIQKFAKIRPRAKKVIFWGSKMGPWNHQNFTFSHFWPTWWKKWNFTFFRGRFWTPKKTQNRADRVLNGFWGFSGVPGRTPKSARIGPNRPKSALSWKSRFFRFSGVPPGPPKIGRGARNGQKWADYD